MKIKLIALLIVIIGGFAACKKNDTETSEEILTRKIADIIPQKYMDTLTNLGLVVNQGTTPPIVEGYYSLTPLKLKKSNVSADVVGMTFISAKVRFFEQSSKDFGIKLLGKNFFGAADTSVVTAISGSGNNFTVYGRVKSIASGKQAFFGILLSGVKDGNNLKDVTYGLINIDNSKGGTVFISEGKGRIIYDTNAISEMITAGTFSTLKAVALNESSGGLR